MISNSVAVRQRSDKKSINNNINQKQDTLFGHTNGNNETINNVKTCKIKKKDSACD